MRKSLVAALIVLAGGTVAVVGSLTGLHAAPVDAARNQAQSHCTWLSTSLKEAQSIKVGDTRAKLQQVFAQEGGISTRLRRTYAYRGCPFIKVDVEFNPGTMAGDADTESSDDVIAKISRPYLDWQVAD